MVVRILPLLSVAFVLSSFGETRSARGMEPPPTTNKVPVTTELHGQVLTDEYQWLENPEDPAVQLWTRQQAERTRDYLDSIPERAKILTELKNAILGKTVRYSKPIFAGGKLFVAKLEPPKPQPVIVVRASVTDGEERVVFDPAALDPQGLTSFDWYQPSPDGKLIAISISKAGSESGTLNFIQVADGKILDEKIERVQFATAGGSVAWNAEGDGVFYTRFPAPGERNDADAHFYQQVYFHRLGTEASTDRYEIGRQFPRIAEIELHRSVNGKFILAAIANGDGGQFAHWLRTPDGKWTPLTEFSDGVKQVVFGGEENLFLRSIKGALKGQVLRLRLNPGIQSIGQAKLVVPESEDSAIEKIAASEGDLLVADVVGGPSRLRHFDSEGKTLGNLSLPPLAAVANLVVTDDGRFLFRETRYTRPPVTMIFDPAAGQSSQTALSDQLSVSFDDIDEHAELATAKDGTKIPVVILMRQGTVLNGKNPTILTGYGSYGIRIPPEMNIFFRPMFDRGAIYAIAGIRGGGEYGEPWHQAGALTKKQTTIDDFAAAAQFLVHAKYTEPEKLGVIGGSAGGITVGGLLTQYPERCKAVCGVVGVFDALRSEFEPNGQFNVTEFGSTKDPEQFRALLGYSPFARVKEGVQYPAVLLMTGENDHRVASWHSKKMAARLQAATRSENPVFLRVSTTAGHGIGTSFDERLNERADQFAFFFDQLGMAGE